MGLKEATTHKPTGTKSATKRLETHPLEHPND